MKVVNHLPGVDYVGQIVASGPDHWETEDKIESIKDCGVAPAKKMVYISPLVYRKIKALMNKYTSREWLAYLIGKDDETGVFVADIYFPKQTATSAHVDDVELPASVKVIGVMHSHHSMGNSFSGTDHEFINDNHNVSVLVSHKEITGQYRYITPCNRYKIIPITVQVHYDIEFDEETFIEEADKKMNTWKSTPVSRYDGVYPEHRFSEDGKPTTTSMPKDEDIEKALEELDFEKDASLVQEFEGVDVEDVIDAEEYENFMEGCEEDSDDSLAEDMAKLGEVTICDE